jgi:hypothetical protein
MSVLMRTCWAVTFLSIPLAGCIGKPRNPAATQPATAIDPAIAEPAYWLSQPAAAEDSLGAIRRTIHFQFTRNLDGSYTVTPKVVVERESRVEPKYATEIQKPSLYWYALRRDTALEAKLAASIESKLKT